MLNSNSRTPGKRRSPLPGVILGAILLFSAVLMGQSTSGAAGIRGTVFDQNGAPVAGVKVTVTNRATAFVVQRETSSAGIYSSGPLQPGEYLVRAEAKGFHKTELAVIARVAIVTAANFRLEPGPEIQVAATAPADTTQINTEQPTVQSQLTPTQMDLLPIIGNDIFDLAQFAPGVQLQDAAVLAPGKNGFSSISFLSRYGRAARVEVDGVSISDETTGGTTQSIPASAILEFNLAQSTLDLPTETTSSGVMNIATRAGSNALHGEGFGVFRGNEVSANLPGGQQSFRREQFGGRVGGALIKDKLFWFLAGERTQQDLIGLENFPSPFNALAARLSQPFRESVGDGRLDWQRRQDAHAFYRFSFDQVGQVRAFGAASSLQAIGTATHTPSNTFGYDFTHGAYTHSIRVAYQWMRSGIGDNTATIPAGPANPVPGLGINIGTAIAGSCELSGGGAFCAGPSALAPQVTFQSNLVGRYDGTRVLAHHVFRYGATFNRVEAGGFAALFAHPQVGANSLCLPGSTQTDCLTSSDPTAYPADSVYLGNGLNFSTGKSAFGLSGGGLGPDYQVEAYVGDGWKIKPNLTLTYGVRYAYDTERVDNNLGSLSVLNEWQPGFSNSVRNPKFDFAPQFGFAWNLQGNGVTVVRGGGGLYYDSSLLANALVDSRARTAQGRFAYTPQVCAFGNAVPFTWPGSVAGLPVNSAIAGGTAVVTNPAANQVAPTFCGDTISTAASPIQALSGAFQAATAANGSSQANPNYVPNALSAVNANGVDVFSPDYLTPRAIQVNLGFQHEVRPGTVFSVDYVRNIGDHNLLITDANHSGAARSYNYLNAIAARDQVETAAGCVPGGLGQAQCVINALGSVAAAQAAFSAAGLDSNSATAGGGPCSFCAFPGVTRFGINTNGAGGGSGSLGTLDMMSTIGRSVYAGWQGKLVQRVTNPMQGVKTATVQLAYTYSKFTSQDTDEDLPGVATNNDNPRQFTGPNGLDRKHQISMGGTFDLPKQLKLSLVARLYSPLAETLRLPELTNGGEIFASDWLGTGLGSGAAAEPLKGTQIGQFMRGSTDISRLQRVISTYNINFAGTLTPAGHCLAADTACPGSAPIQVMTADDMAALQWVMPVVPSIPNAAAGPPWLKTVDLRLAWPITIRDRVTIQPSASVFNAINFANAFLPGDLPNGSMLPGANPTFVTSGVLAPNVVGGVTKAGLTPFRAGFQSGTFASGAPRQIEFGLRISF